MVLPTSPLYLPLEIQKERTRVKTGVFYLMAKKSNESQSPKAIKTSNHIDIHPRLMVRSGAVRER